MLRWGLLLTNILMGIGAFAGSSLALLPKARESVGIDDSMLVHSPFTTFLIPGLFLLVVLSFGNILVGVLTFKNRPNASYYECIIGIILCLWIIIQCLMIWDIVALHIIFFGIGVIQLFLGCQIIRQQKIAFPFSAHQN